MLVVGLCYDYDGMELYEIYLVPYIEDGRSYECLNNTEIDEFLKDCEYSECTYEQYLNCKVKLTKCCGG